MKLLNGTNLAAYIKERQAQELRKTFGVSSDPPHFSHSGSRVNSNHSDASDVNPREKSPAGGIFPGGEIRERMNDRNCPTKPQLAIIRDNDTPVIAKYVSLKKQYGTDIGITVVDHLVPTLELKNTITQANQNPAISGIILQLPLLDPTQTDALISQISPQKDVDGLSPNSHFDSATALAIHHLLAGYNIDLSNKKIAIIGTGRLVGTPLAKMWRASNYNVTVFNSTTPLKDLNTFDLIITATGHPNLITPQMIKKDVILVDAGTASEAGHLVGDVSESVRNLPNITITPKIGGVGPMTITMLFENLLNKAAQ